MSKARQLADLLDSNGDVNTGALDNVPPSNDASALTTGTLDAARIADGSVANAKLASDLDASKVTTGTLPVDRVPYLGRRNVLINGSFTVNQRGQISSSPTAISSDRYIIDRWFFRKSNSTSNPVTLLLNQSVTGLGKTNVLKIENFNDSAWVGQYVEIAANTFLSGQEVTVSYYAKADATLSGFSVFLHDNYDGGTHGNPYFTNSQTISTSWQRYTHTMTVGDLANDNANGYLNLAFGQADTNTAIYLAGVQLEVGSVATPFEHRSYGEELALCQRYFYRYGISGTPFMTSGAYTTHQSHAQFYIYFPVSMRSSPSNTAFSTNYFTYGGIEKTTDFCWIYGSATASGSGARMLSGLDFDAEL